MSLTFPWSGLDTMSAIESEQIATALGGITSLPLAAVDQVAYNGSKLLIFSVLMGVPTFGCSVYNKDFLAFVFGEVYIGIASRGFQLIIIYDFGSSSGLNWVDGFVFAKYAGKDQ
jgi:hypothetical protein